MLRRINPSLRLNFNPQIQIPLRTLKKHSQGLNIDLFRRQLGGVNREISKFSSNVNTRLNKISLTVIGEPLASAQEEHLQASFTEPVDKALEALRTTVPEAKKTLEMSDTIEPKANSSAPELESQKTSQKEIPIEPKKSHDSYRKFTLISHGISLSFVSAFLGLSALFLYNQCNNPKTKFEWDDFCPVAIYREKSINSVFKKHQWVSDLYKALKVMTFSNEAKFQEFMKLQDIWRILSAIESLIDGYSEPHGVKPKSVHQAISKSVEYLWNLEDKYYYRKSVNYAINKSHDAFLCATSLFINELKLDKYETHYFFEHAISNYKLDTAAFMMKHFSEIKVSQDQMQVIIRNNATDLAKMAMPKCKDKCALFYDSVSSDNDEMILILLENKVPLTNRESKITNRLLMMPGNKGIDAILKHDLLKPGSIYCEHIMRKIVTTGKPADFRKVLDKLHRPLSDKMKSELMSIAIEHKNESMMEYLLSVPSVSTG